jgi:hypothetical protein
VGHLNSLSGLGIGGQSEGGGPLSVSD